MDGSVPMQTHARGPTVIYRRQTALFLAFMACIFLQHPADCCDGGGGLREIKEPELAAELRKRFESDQAIRNRIIEFYKEHKLVDGSREFAKLDPLVAEKWNSLRKEIEAEDMKNRHWMKEVVRKHGWPGKSLVGSQGAMDAWLLVQHADADREFQQECLSKMEALPTGEVRAVDIAYLTDRILCGTGKKQKYGSQVVMKDGKFIPQPIEDEEHVDDRRKAIGLEPLSDYLKTIAKVYGASTEVKPSKE